MNREYIVNILESMRTEENSTEIDELLKALKKLSDNDINARLKQIGDSEEAVRAFFQTQIESRKYRRTDHIHIEHTPVNKMFTYGITGNSIHLHMPHDLRPLLAKKGIRETVYMVNLYLLDAIDRLRTLKNNGLEKFKEIDQFYMISPILMGKEIKFLEDLDFETRTYKKHDLNNPEFLQTNSEALLGVSLFGSENNIGVASIGIDTVNSSEWQAKKQEIINRIAKKGVSLETDDIDIPE